MSKERYTVRYYGRNNNPVITAVSNYGELYELLKGDAKGCFMETRISDNMPVAMHNLVADHNKTTKNPYKV